MSNILKNTNVKSSNIISSKNISIGQRLELNPFNSSLDLQKKAQDFEQYLMQMESQHNQILEQLEVDKIKILEDTKSLSEQIEKDAYQRGYEEGQRNGYEDGYKEAYDENIDKARFEAEAIIQEANETLLNANSLLEAYLKENKKNVIELAITIAEHVLKEKFEETDSMNKLVEDTIMNYGTKKSIVVKVNPLYVSELEKQMNQLKERENIQEDIFVLAYEAIDKGNVVIETEKGSVHTGIDTVLDALKEELR